MSLNKILYTELYQEHLDNTLFYPYNNIYAIQRETYFNICCVQGWNVLNNVFKTV